jgi:hypothetical protein
MVLTLSLMHDLITFGITTFLLVTVLATRDEKIQFEKSITVLVTRGEKMQFGKLITVLATNGEEIQFE